MYHHGMCVDVDVCKVARRTAVVLPFQVQNQMQNHNLTQAQTHLLTQRRLEMSRNHKTRALMMRQLLQSQVDCFGQHMTYTAQHLQMLSAWQACMVSAFVLAADCVVLLTMCAVLKLMHASCAANAL